jgi:hypothetical protein
MFSQHVPLIKFRGFTPATRRHIPEDDYDLYPELLVKVLLYLLLEGSKDGDRHSLNTFCLCTVSIVSIVLSVYSVHSVHSSV